MTVIKGKEKKLSKPIKPVSRNMSKKAKRILSRPQDNQPIAAVGVS